MRPPCPSYESPIPAYVWETLSIKSNGIVQCLVECTLVYGKKYESSLGRSLSCFLVSPSSTTLFLYLGMEDFTSNYQSYLNNLASPLAYKGHLVEAPSFVQLKTMLTNLSLGAASTRCGGGNQFQGSILGC